MGSLTLLGVGGPEPAQGVTWNPFDKSTAITLSNGNLTATRNTNAADNSAALVRCTLGRLTGKYAWAVDPTVIVDSVHYYVGGALSTVLTGDDLGGTGSFAWWAFGAFTCNTAVLTAPFSYTAANSELMFAIDLTARKLWIRRDAGAWDPSGDPAAGTGGYDISALVGTIYPAVSLRWSTEAVIANFGGSVFANALPAGFVAWNTP